MLNLDKTSWLEQEFELGGREWRINKLQPILAKDVLIDHVRPVLASLDGIDMSKPEAIAVLFGRIPGVHMKALSKVFSEKCIRTRNDVGQWVLLKTDVEKFTKDMDPIDLLMLDLKALAVNFGESVSKCVSRMLDLAGKDLQSVQESLTSSSTQE